MKNKKLLFVLVPGVLFVWGMIIYRIMEGVQDSPVIVYDKTQHLTFAKVDQQKDTFKLLLNYRDPFLNHRRKRKSTQNQTQKDDKQQTLIESKIKQEEVWPNIVYAGIIKNKKSKQRIGLIQIDQQDYLLQERESVGAFKVLRLTNDSIVVSNGKTKKVVYQ